MNIQQALGEAISGRDLKREDMQSVMQAIMTGEATAAQIAGFLVALRMKGETVDEPTILIFSASTPVMDGVTIRSPTSSFDRSVRPHAAANNKAAAARIGARPEESARVMPDSFPVAPASIRNPGRRQTR